MHYLSQEIEARYIIPAVRKAVAKCLIDDFGASYEKVGVMLGISKAAISQYLRGKRANKIKLPVALNNAVMTSCKKLAFGKSDYVSELSEILETIRKKKMRITVSQKLKERNSEKYKDLIYNGKIYLSR